MTVLIAAAAIIIGVATVSVTALIALDLADTEPKAKAPARRRYPPPSRPYPPPEHEQTVQLAAVPGHPGQPIDADRFVRLLGHA